MHMERGGVHTAQAHREQLHYRRVANRMRNNEEVPTGDIKDKPK
jgi:hypothetical protein